MKVRQHTLPVLQNLLKRDPPAYKEEFEAIWRQYLSELEVFKLRAQQALMKKFQRCLFFHCGDASREGSDKSAKVALDAVVDLYGRGVWTCAPTVNCVGRACVDDRSKLACTAIHFFLGIEQSPVLDELDSDDEDARDAGKASDAIKGPARAVAATTAHQKDAPKLLAVAQACHDLVPPDELVAAARKIADAVVVAARGWINVVREHYPRCSTRRTGAPRRRVAERRILAATAAAVEGEELLRAYERGDLPEDFDDAVRECDGVGEGVKDDDGAGWVDVDDDDGGAEEDGAEVVEDEDDEEEEAGEDDDEEEAGEDDEDDGEEDEEGGWEEASDDDDDGEDGDEGWQDASDDGEAAAPAAKKVRFDAPETAAEAARAAPPPGHRIFSGDDHASACSKAAAELSAAGGRAGASGQGFLQSNDILPDAVKRKTSVEAQGRRRSTASSTSSRRTLAARRTRRSGTKNYLMVQKKKARTNGLKKRTRGAPKEQLKRDKRKRRRL
ncbi:hypothetical protein JL721_8071 [Aureococcus anophagefferens]|nr:hypothetical protein JL721_8071 [Aureococcus anophagefferens]